MVGTESSQLKFEKNVKLYIKFLPTKTTNIVE